MSRQALRFAVDDRLSPIKIECVPTLKNQEGSALIVKEFLTHIEQDFRKLNPQFNQPLGFDDYTIDNNG